MESLRLYDASRRPANWTDLVRPDQFVAFASDADSGAPLDADGRPFASPGEGTCLVFDSLAEARRFCEAQVEGPPRLQFDVFEGASRAEPPILVVVSRARAARNEASPRAMRLRRWIAIGLILGAIPLIYYDTWTQRGVLVLPTFLGVSMVVAALRLLFANQVVREAEETRRSRATRHG